MKAHISHLCQQFVEDITAFLEGALSDETVKLIDAHLVGCPHCREYLDQMQRTIALTGTLGAHDLNAMPDELRDRLIRAFRDRHP